MFLNLKFFQDQSEEKVDLSKFKNPIMATSGHNFLYFVDDCYRIHKIALKGSYQCIISSLDSFDKFFAQSDKQRLLCAQAVKNSNQFSYKIQLIKTENGTDVGASDPIILQHKSKALDFPSNLYVSPNFTYLAFSTSNNEILVYKEPFSTSSKPTTTFNSTDKITNLVITDNGSIYYTTESSVNYCTINDKKPRVLEDGGVQPQLAFLTHDEIFYVLRNKTITMLFSDDTPKITYTFNNEENINGFGPVDNSIYVSFDKSFSQSFQVIDLKYNFRLFDTNAGTTTKFVQYVWGALVLIGNDPDQTVRMYQEISPQSKVTALCNYTKFEEALKMAAAYKLGDEAIANIHRSYGDHFFDHNRFDEAMDHYVLTTHFTEPSHVIAKFVEPQHAQNLARYLQAIPSELKSKQHTTLLFNCFTKVKDIDNLRKVVEKFVAEAASNSSPSFDVATAVDVLKRNGYEEFAKELARAYNQYSIYMSLMYEGQRYSEMLEYMRSMPGANVKPQLLDYGAEILAKYPEGRDEFIDFAVQCCTAPIDNGPNRRPMELKPSDLAPIFVSNTEAHFQFLHRIYAKNKASLDPESWNTLVELALRSNAEDRSQILNDPEAKYSQELALIYMNAFDYKEGMLDAYEHMKLYPLILQAAEPSEVLEICQKYGEEMKTLWNDGLVKLADSDCDEATLERFLDELRKADVVPFLTVLNVLKNHGKHSFKAVLPLVTEVFTREQELLRKANVEAKAHRDEARKNDAVSQQIANQNFKLSVRKKCAQCNGEIETDSQHFFCGHSFHTFCLGDSTDICPICRNEHEKIAIEKVRRMEEARSTKAEPCAGFNSMVSDIANSLFDSGIVLDEESDNKAAYEDALEFKKKFYSKN